MKFSLLGPTECRRRSLQFGVLGQPPAKGPLGGRDPSLRAEHATMHDSAIPASRIITFTLWAATVVVLATSWLLAASDQWRLAQQFGYTAGALSAGAAVSHVRCYMLRVTALIKLYGNSMAERSMPSEGAEIRALR